MKKSEIIHTLVDKEKAKKQIIENSRIIKVLACFYTLFYLHFYKGVWHLRIKSCKKDEIINGKRGRRKYILFL